MSAGKGDTPRPVNMARWGANYEAIFRKAKNQPARFVRMFKPQFAGMVEDGDKLQTVRPTPERMPKAGDRISLRTWTGKPYRSKQRILREATITKVARVEITETGIAVNSLAEPCDDFARADGFLDFFEFADWFRNTHGLPFEGIVIYWRNDT